MGHETPNDTAPTEAIRARAASITGKPPRIAPLKPEEFGPEAYEALRVMREAIGAPPGGDMPTFNATMLRHPELSRAHSELALGLFHGALSPRDRELAILRTGWLCRAPFQWGSHAQIAKRVANITAEEVERVTHGSTASGWGEHDRAILRAVEELYEDAMISDETWAELARELDEKQLIELPVLVGQYQGVAYLQNSLRIGLMPGNRGLLAR